MCLVVNAHDDWQLRFSDKFKRIINQFLKDNQKLYKQRHDNFRYEDRSYLRCYQDMKEFFGDALIRYMRNQNPNYTSTHQPDELTSYNMIKSAKLYLKSYFDNDLYEITKLGGEEDDDSSNIGSSIEICGNQIQLFEKPRDMIFINHIDNPRHLGISRELRETVRQSKLEFALEPYIDYLNLPEIEYYRQKGQLKTTQNSIIIKNCSLILAFGMKRLVDDLNTNTIIPGFEMTNKDDYDVVQPKIKFLKF